jgi:microcystin-dependent protein
VTIRPAAQLSSRDLAGVLDWIDRTTAGGALEPDAQDRSVPAGTCALTAGTETPEGWLFCEGQLLLRETWPELAGALGDRWAQPGDTDPTLFRLPDLRGKFVRGATGEIDEELSGGVDEVVLTEANLPAVELSVTIAPHTHTLATQILTPGGSVSVASGTVPIYPGVPSALTLNSATPTATATLDGTAEPITGLVPPYVALRWIIRT